MASRSLNLDPRLIALLQAHPELLGDSIAAHLQNLSLPGSTPNNASCDMVVEEEFLLPSNLLDDPYPLESYVAPPHTSTGLEHAQKTFEKELPAADIAAQLAMKSSLPAPSHYNNAVDPAAEEGEFTITTKVHSDPSLESAETIARPAKSEKKPPAKKKSNDAGSSSDTKQHNRQWYEFRKQKKQAAAAASQNDKNGQNRNVGQTGAKKTQSPYAGAHRNNGGAYARNGQQQNGHRR